MLHLLLTQYNPVIAHPTHFGIDLHDPYPPSIFGEIKDDDGLKYNDFLASSTYEALSKFTGDNLSGLQGVNDDYPFVTVTTKDTSKFPLDNIVIRYMDEMTGRIVNEIQYQSSTSENFSFNRFLAGTTYFSEESKQYGEINSLSQYIPNNCSEFYQDKIQLCNQTLKANLVNETSDMWEDMMQTLKLNDIRDIITCETSSNCTIDSNSFKEFHQNVTSKLESYWNKVVVPVNTIGYTAAWPVVAFWGYLSVVDYSIVFFLANLTKDKEVMLEAVNNIKDFSTKYLKLELPKIISELAGNPYTSDPVDIDFINHHLSGSLLQMKNLIYIMDNFVQPTRNISNEKPSVPQNILPPPKSDQNISFHLSPEHASIKQNFVLDNGAGKYSMGACLLFLMLHFI